MVDCVRRIKCHVPIRLDRADAGFPVICFTQHFYMIDVNAVAVAYAAILRGAVEIALVLKQ